jgi:hypothetical protein
MPGNPGTKRLLTEYLTHNADDSLSWQGSRIGNAPADPLWVSAPSMNDNSMNRFTLFEDDFLQQASATASAYTTYTDMNDGATGTNAFANSAGGVIQIVTAAALDDYHGLRTTAKPWLFAAGKELWFEAAFTVTEAATNASSWLFGLMDTATTGGLQTGASGPLASFSGCVIYKVQGTMTAKCLSSNSSTQVSGSTIATVVSGQRVRVGFYFDGAATTSNIFPFVDIGDGNGYVAGTSQAITLASLNQMSLMMTIKAGGSNAETLGIDWVKVLQLR